MTRSFLPFLFLPSHAAAALVGRHRDKVAVLALQAVLRNRRSLEIAHQQIVWRGQALALSSRITQRGELVVELDVGDDRLADRLILEDELKAAQRNGMRGIARRASA